MFAGTLGALAAVLTGDMAESAARAGTVPISVTNFSQVVSMHENFADLTLIIFGVLAAAYFFSWLAKINFGAFMEKISLGGLWKFLAGFGKIFADSRVSIILALLGLISVTITGGLGGIMVYGPGVDPFFGMVFKLFFK